MGQQMRILLRRRQAQLAFGLQHSAFYEGIRAGVIPIGVKIGARATAWPSDEIQKVVDARIAGLDCDKIKMLVSKLHAERTSLGGGL